MRRMNFLVVGGDMRQKYLAGLLSEEGHDVSVLAIDDPPKGTAALLTLFDVRRMDCVILPLPVLRDDGYIHAPLSETVLSVEKLFENLVSGQTVVGGKIPPSLYEAAGRRGVRLYDYLDREEMAVLNAIPTVEGAVEIALSELPITLHGAKALVIGFGRIGKLLARLLSAFGTDVTVSARKYADFAWCDALGYKKLHTAELSGCLSEFDVIFNTVPQTVLPEALLRELKSDCLIIDLASKPGGLDFKTAADIGIKAVWALSLPGKVAPMTSGKIIGDTVKNILDEWGVT